jgi:hypothetical protein
MIKQNLWFYAVIILSMPFVFFTFLKHPEPEIHTVWVQPTPSDPIENIYFKFENLNSDVSDYIWPTNASRRISSSFAEFRNTHFHGGIDISTNKKTGYEVYAVRDGYVWRIQILPDGYGKMLYVKHLDGYITTYAHLKSFNSEISEVLKQEQYRRETYAINVQLDSTKLPVKKGDVIAYTGDTGAGPAHLHFEIRDENLNYVNPFLFENFKDGDNSAPLIKKISVYPLDIYSYANNRSDPYFYKNPKRAYRKTQLPKAVEISGQIGLGIETIDISSDAANRSGVYSIELSLDDSVIYQVKFDRIPSDALKQILLHYDLPSIYSGAGKFQKLFVEQGTTLPIYNRLPYGAGIINTKLLSEGIHHFKILVKDFSGNESEFNGKLLVDNQREIHSNKIITEHYPLYPIPTDKAGTFMVYGTPIKISYDSGAVFKPIKIYIDSSKENGTTVYSFSPQDVLLNKGITISIDTDKNNKLGLYTKLTGGWRFQTNQLDPDGKSLTTKFTRTLGDIALFEDSKSPTISRLKIQVRNQRPNISFKYHDNLSGFNDDKFRMFIDDNLVIPEIEWEKRSIWYHGDQKLEKGIHSLKIVIADKAGNVNEINTTFRIR